MNYLLVVLSHGHPYSDTAEETLDSFAEQVSEFPTHTLLLHDGPGWAYCNEHLAPNSMELRVTENEQVGFCEATRRLWRLAHVRAAIMRIPYVFWLEHDFVFSRPVPIADMALVLDSDQTIAQAQLMRGPVNEKETAAGGLYESRPGEYWGGGHDPAHLLHASYFTTNPSLMRTDFMQAHPWPDVPAQCEGHMGVQLCEQGYRFAVMGEGEPWVEHIGKLRTGVGY